jgi:prepilin-type N-terminal cleavage/methylation domain-containing protein
MVWPSICNVIGARPRKKKLEATSFRTKQILGGQNFRGETMKITNEQKGFSLIELLIVVAIILIIAAIAIPNLLRARMAANESSAVGSLRTIVTSEFNYQQTYGIGYAPLTNLGSTTPCAPATLATSAAACLVDSQLSSGTKSGYNVTTPAPAAVGTSAAPNNTFTAVAVPTVIGQSGQRGFYADQSGVIRFTTDGTTPLATSPALQ